MAGLPQPLVTIVLTASMFLAVTGCAKDDSPVPGPAATATSTTKGVIGLSVLTLTNPFFKVIADTVKAEAAKQGYDVLITSGEFDPAKQQDQVQEFIVKKVSAIVLTPCDSKSISTAIKQANQAGIPVFTADIACLDPDVKVVSHIATDNYNGGCLVAQAMMEALGNQGKVAIIDLPEIESVILRTRGFRDELKQANSPIEVVGAWPGKGSKDESFKVAQEILQAHPDLNGIFAINDPTALGAYAAVEIAGKTKQIVIVGFDGQPEGKKAILEGKIYADPVQFPERIGQTTVQAILQYFNGEKVAPEILIPTALYYQKDAEKDPLFTDVAQP